MAGSFSQTIILGNVGRDPEIATLKSGAKVASISLATSTSWTDTQTAKREERVEWHRVKIWHESTVSVVERFVHKGSLIQVVGRNETSKWKDSTGNDRYTTEVVVRGAFCLTLIDRGEDGDGFKSDRHTSQRHERKPPRQSDGWSSSNDLDDEIPF